MRQVAVPWAVPESGFTVMFEAFVMALAREPERSGDSLPQAARRASEARQMPVAAVAGLVAEHDTALWRVVRHYVREAHGRQDWSGVQGRGPLMRRSRAKGTATRRWWWKWIRTRSARRGFCS